MGVLGKMEVDIDIKLSGDKFFRLWASKPYYTPNITPQKIQCCELLEGKVGQPGSVLLWIYTLADGKMLYSKTIIDIDEENKLVSFKVLQGSVLEEYKSFTVITQVLTKGETTTAKWVVEYERVNDYGPYPNDYMDFFIGITRDVDAYYLKD